MLKVRPPKVNRTCLSLFSNSFKMSNKAHSMLVAHLVQFEYEIVFPLKEYLNEEWTFSGLNELLNTCKSLSAFKRKHYYWKVKEDQMNREVLSKILSRMQSPCKQLSVIAISECVSLSGSEANKVSLSELTNVHELRISWYYTLSAEDTLRPWSCVHSLEISNCRNISDVSLLGGVHSLKLSWCRSISDISALDGVHHLEIFCCLQLPDVYHSGSIPNNRTRQYKKY